LKILHDAMAPVGILRPIAWILPILIRIPGAAGGDKVFFNFVNSQIAARKEVNRTLEEPVFEQVFINGIFRKSPRCQML
jgi:hypothetical protein